MRSPAARWARDDATSAASRQPPAVSREGLGPPASPPEGLAGFLGAWAASRFRPIHVLPAAAGALIGTVLIWVVVVIRRDAQEVGTVGAVLEGALIGGAIAVPGVALFLLVRRRLAAPRKT